MSKPPGFSRLLLLLGAISLLTPFSLDMYLPALPAIAADLQAGAGAVQLTLPAFFAGLAVSQLLFGTLADHLGRRPPLLCGLLLSVIGSMGCAMCGSVHSLTVWRTVQALGVGSASVIPRAVIRDRFDVAHTARALSLLGLITGFGPILAPQLGGAVLLVTGWRVMFWLLTALGVGCLGIAYVMLRESIPAQRSAVTGPKLWFALLTDRRYVRYALPANLIQSSVFAYIAGAAFVYIDHFKLSPQQFAWMFGLNALGLMIVGRINAHIVGRLGPELIFRRAMLATAALGVVLLLIAVTDIGGFWAIAIPQALFVAMLGFNFSNGFALALAHFGSAAGTASALFGTLQFLFAGVAGSAVGFFYDGTAHAMAGVMCAVSLGAVLLYRCIK
ncbi:MAG: multidrug effflux MFS transporter [Steroidobacteraceae bacterium]|jgi:DHA1 family bicyclomycin/chloramphenicol resistance-like MFS transporter